MNSFLFSIISIALFRSVPVVLVGLAFFIAMRGKSSANRHMVCVITLAICMSLPFLGLIPHRNNIRVPVIAQTLAQPISTPTRAVIQAVQGTPLPPPTTVQNSSISVSDAICYLYVMVVGCLVIRHLASFIVLGAAVRRSTIHSKVCNYSIRISSKVHVPLATWWGRPTIMLPVDSVNWPPARFATTIQHEISHIHRGDLVFVWLSFAAKTIYWPNPLVWILGSKMLDSAESATDDCVLKTGVPPTDYADVLVLTARERRQSIPVITVAMARPSSVRRRVQAILDPLRTRGSATPWISLSTGALVSMCAFGVCSIGIQDLKKVAIPNTYEWDVRNGETVPAEAANDFTAVASDGKKIQLIRVQRWTPHGVESWKPDGTPVPKSEQIADNWHRHDVTEYHLYSRFEDDGKIQMDGAGIGSGPHSPGSPDRMTFMGGGPMKRQGKMQTVMSLLQVPKLGTSGTVSLSFGYYEQVGKPIYTVYPNAKELNSGAIPPDLKNEFISDFQDSVHLQYPANATPFVYDEHGDGIPLGKGQYKHLNVKSTKISYTELTEAMGNHMVNPTAYHAGTLTPIEHIWNEGKQKGGLYDFSYFWAVPPQDIDHIDINLHKTFHVVYLNVRLSTKVGTP